MPKKKFEDFMKDFENNCFDLSEMEETYETDVYDELEELSPTKIALLFKELPRPEMIDNPKIYFKAVQATLIGLGYNRTWVLNDFQELLEDKFSSFI